MDGSDLALLEHRALRASVALSELDHLAALRLSGDDAFDLIERLLPADLQAVLTALETGDG